MTRRRLALPTAPFASVPLDRQAGLRALVQVEEVADVLRSETVPVTTPSPEEASRGEQPVRGSTVGVARLAAPALAHGTTTPPVMPAARGASDAQPHAGGRLMRRQRARAEGTTPLRSVGVHPSDRLRMKLVCASHRTKSCEHGRQPQTNIRKGGL